MFGKDEYATRLNNVKERMDKIDILLLSDPCNIHYITGFDGESFYVPQILVITKDCDEPVLILRKIDKNAATVTTYLHECNVLSYDDEYIHSQTTHVYEYVATYLKDKYPEESVIGVELDSYYFTAKSFLILQNRLNKATIIDSNNLVNWIRLIKSDLEIDYMKKAAHNAEKIMKTAIEKISSKKKLSNIVGSILKKSWEGCDNNEGGSPAIQPVLSSGNGAAHLTDPSKIVEINEGIFIELCGVYRRYHCPIARTVYMGTPPEKWLTLNRVVIKGLNKALKSIRPGITAEDIEQKWQEYINKHGYTKDSRLGYSIGIGYPPDWGEKTVSLRANDKTILQPNMCFHVIAGMWMDDWGIEQSESIIITKTGYESLCNFPKSLFIK